MENKDTKLVRRALPAALLTVFIDAVGVAIIIPVYILLVLPGPQRVIPASWSLQSGFIFLGWLTGIYSLCVFLRFTAFTASSGLKVFFLRYEELPKRSPCF